MVQQVEGLTLGAGGQGEEGIATAGQSTMSAENTIAAVPEGTVAMTGGTSSSAVENSADSLEDHAVARLESATVRTSEYGFGPWKGWVCPFFEY